MNKYLKIAAVFFLFLLLFRAGGFLTFFHIQQRMIKEEIKKQIITGLPEHQLKIFKFSENENAFTSKEIKWVEKNEFIFEGKMYDVVKVKNVCDEKWFYCFEDTKETALVLHLDQIQKDLLSNPLEKNCTNLLVQLLTTPFEIHTFHTAANMAASSIKTIHYIFGLKTWISIPNSPPPRF